MPTGEFTFAMQIVDRPTGMLFFWSGDAPGMVRVYPRQAEPGTAYMPIATIPFTGINPVNGIPALHSLITTARTFLSYREKQAG